MIVTPGGEGFGRADIRARSELARHLRPSIFPADRAAVLECARDEDAPEAMLDRLAELPDRKFVNVEAVWEALGGAHEPRTHAGPDPEVQAEPGPPAAPEPAAALPGPERFAMRFDARYRLAALPFGVTADTAYVLVHGDRFEAHFGPWTVDTGLSNIAGVELTGPYRILTTIGPPHLSLADRGLTFATNRDRGLCIRFHAPVRGIDPIGALLHPGLTVTVEDLEGLRRALDPAQGLT
jgi:hypothetical protein